MRIQVIQGIIDRRVLTNYRVDPPLWPGFCRRRFTQNSFGIMKLAAFA